MGHPIHRPTVVRILRLTLLVSLLTTLIAPYETSAHAASLAISLPDGAISVTDSYEEGAVKPILECVADVGDSVYEARFGYLNENVEPITIPIGDDNKFSPAPVNRGQSTEFLPGRVVNAFSVDFTGDNLVWTLEGPDDRRRTATASAGSTRCAPTGPNNTSWPNALDIDLVGSPAGGAPRVIQFDEAQTGVVTGYLEELGESRWYKFAVQPNSQATITLQDLPADYNLTVYRDIQAAYNDLLLAQDDLTLLNAEFAPEAFSPEAFSPEAFSPEAFSPEAFSPEAFSPEAFSPLVFAPEAFSPEAFSPEAFSPEAFSPEAFSPEAFSPEAFSPEAFSPEAFSPEAFSPEAFSAAQSKNILGVSSFLGLTAEGLILNTWNNTGDFYVRVSGRNGAFSLASPYTLTVTLSSGACLGVSAELPPSSLTPANGGFDTLILADLGRLDGDTAELQARLDTFAARAEIAGTIIDVGADARVIAANAQADANPACPYAKNLVADAIEEIVDAYWELNPLKYIVIVGGDNVIPFFRYPDQALLAPEQNYVPPVRDFTASQASLRLSYVLGQDEYGSRFDLSTGADLLPIPQLGVGRLVETPAEITTMLDAYLSTAAGVVATPDSALVTGYDFLDDAALAVESELAAGIGTSINTLLTPGDVAPTDPSSWTADDLRSALLGQRNDLIFLAGHFSASGALAADYSTRLSAGEVALSLVDLTNALIYSAGCHSGYNVVNEHAVPNLTEQPDWAQAFARKGATFIGGTGYQYGDTEFIEYGERLYLEFTRQLRLGTGPVAIGTALADAKRVYLAETPELRGIHEKTIIQSTLFGLPMLSVDLPAGRISDPAARAMATSTTGYLTDPGATLGLSYADVTVAPSLTRQDIDLTNIADNSTQTATYWTGADGTITNPAEPVLPLEVVDATVENTTLRGVGFRGGDFEDIPNLVPLTGAPATEIRGVHGFFFTETFYPVRTWSVNYIGALIDGITRLNVTPLQVISSPANPMLSIARKFTNLDFRLFYSNNTVSYNGNRPSLAARPTIVNIAAEVVDNNGNDEVQFQITTVGDPSAGIQEVWITYTGDGSFANKWQSLDLVQDATESALWTGTLPLGASTPSAFRFMVQAVNGVGLVSLDLNLGAYYNLTDDLTNPAPPVRTATSVTLQSPLPTSGRYGETVTLSALLVDDTDAPLANQRVTFSLGSQQRSVFTDGDGIAAIDYPLYASPNTYDLRASYAGNATYAPSFDEASFLLEKQDTDLTPEQPAPSVPVGQDSGIVVTLADDLGRPLSQETVIFTVISQSAAASRSLAANQDTAFSIPIITDYAGRAPLGIVPLPPGIYSVNAYFSGTVPLLPDGTLVLVNELYNSTTSSTLTIEFTDGTVPVTLGWFLAARAGAGVVDFHWQTATETGTAGFNLLAEGADGARNQVNPTLIQSAAIDSVEPLDYRYAAVTDSSSFYLEEVSIEGKRVEYGPFELGVEFGSYSLPSNVELSERVWLPLVMEE